MRDLETRIAQWRAGMRAARIRTPVLEELESHLREEMEHRMQSGADPQQAFQAACERIGSPATLRREFQKVPFKPFLPMTPLARRRLTHVLVVIAIIAVSVALLLPAVAKVKAHQTLAFWDIAVCVVAVLATIGGGIYAARIRKLG